MLALFLAAGLAGAAPEAARPAAAATPPGTEAPARGETARDEAAPDLSPDLAAFVAEAKERLLHGRRLPTDYRLRLRAMDPADRIQAVIFLRRAGLLTGETWGAQELLAEGDDRKDE